MQECLAQGADPNAVDDSGYTPLLWAVHMWEACQLIEPLLQAGADPDKPGARGHCPFHFACGNGLNYGWICDVFVRYGADLEHRDRSGETPLMTAVKTGMDNCAAALLRLGADPFADCGGQTPYGYVQSEPRGARFGQMFLPYAEKKILGEAAGPTAALSNTKPL